MSTPGRQTSVHPTPSSTPIYTHHCFGDGNPTPDGPRDTRPLTCNNMAANTGLAAPPAPDQSPTTCSSTSSGAICPQQCAGRGALPLCEQRDLQTPTRDKLAVSDNECQTHVPDCRSTACLTATPSTLFIQHFSGSTETPQNLLNPPLPQLTTWRRLPPHNAR